MNFKRRQRGMSFLGLIVLVGILGFATVIGLKLIPIYMDAWKIDGVLNAVINEPEVNEWSRKKVIDAMLKRLDIDSVEAVNFSNYKETVTVTKKDSSTTINVYYRVETPLIGNLSIVAEFDKTVST